MAKKKIGRDDELVEFMYLQGVFNVLRKLGLDPETEVKNACGSGQVRFRSKKHTVNPDGSQIWEDVYVELAEFEAWLLKRMKKEDMKWEPASPSSTRN